MGRESLAILKSRCDVSTSKFIWRNPQRARPKWKQFRKKQRKRTANNNGTHTSIANCELRKDCSILTSAIYLVVCQKNVYCSHSKIEHKKRTRSTSTQQPQPAHMLIHIHIHIQRTYSTSSIWLNNELRSPPPGRLGSGAPVRSLFALWLKVLLPFRCWLLVHRARYVFIQFGRLFNCPAVVVASPLGKAYMCLPGCLVFYEHIADRFIRGEVMTLILARDDEHILSRNGGIQRRLRDEVL